MSKVWELLFPFHGSLVCPYLFESKIDKGLHGVIPNDGKTVCLSQAIPNPGGVSPRVPSPGVSSPEVSSPGVSSPGRVSSPGVSSP